MTEWLTSEQQVRWRAWLSIARLLPDRLNRDLLESTGLSLADYEILVRLSENSDRSLRMSDLAEATLSSRSRLSHQIDRMEAAGLVSRRACEQDKRGSFAELTDKGFETLVAAAPHHVASVRANLVDVLSDEEFADFGRACAIVADHLEPSSAPCQSGGRVGL